MNLMRFANLIHILCLSIIGPAVLAQFPPNASNDPTIRTLQSPVDGNITIRYKAPPVGTCTTEYSTQKQYAGYVTLPPFTLTSAQQNYTTNTFFWFIEARVSPETAPLTIYMNGGPGTSSMVGLFQEAGPCEVVEMAEGQLGTQARLWGWDRSSNIIFVDQPNQVGLSYDTPIDGSLNLLNSSTISIPPQDLPAGQPAYSFLNGTFTSGNTNNTANTTGIAAEAVWHMLQGFLSAFPQYNPGLQPNSTIYDNGIVGVNLFVESYGGKFGPAFATFFQSQNNLRQQGFLSQSATLQIDLLSLGIINGCVDDLIQGPYYPRFAFSNTYGIEAISIVEEQTAANAFLAADGCQQLIQSCRAEMAALDPDNNGGSGIVSDKCSQAENNCVASVIDPYDQSGRSIYDITQPTLDPFPKNYFLDYLNTAAVQAAVGAQVNFTMTSQAVANAFISTGDDERGDYIDALASLLSIGIRVALIYGDRDYACNWLGGEAVSFSVAGAAQPAYSNWYNAGYVPIIVNSSYIGGEVRQFGNLSFSRIYDSGHLVPAYQPETAFTVFTRVIEGTQISSGEDMDLSTFYSDGNANSTYTNSAPPMASPTCYLRAVDTTCSLDQKAGLQFGEGVIINGIWYENKSDWIPPVSSISAEAGVPGTAPISAMTIAPTSTGSVPSSSRVSGSTTSSDVATGVYVASVTPSTTMKGGAIPAYQKPITLSALLFAASLLF